MLQRNPKMGLNVRKKQLLSETVLKKCEHCKLVFQEQDNFCPQCGNKLISEKTKVYANIGKNGITSFSYKLASGITINSKGRITFPLGKGMSYTTNTRGKNKF